MPRPPNPEVRQRLIEAGMSLISARGFGSSGVKDITDAAGVPKGSFYNYFSSKESFAIAMLDADWAGVQDHADVAFANTSLDPIARVASFFHAMAQDHASHAFVRGCLIGNLSLELSGESLPVRHKLVELLQRWESILAEALLEAQTAGQIAADQDVHDLAATLIEAWEGAVLRGKVEQRRDSYRRFETSVLPKILGQTALV